ncbi:MAG TPA: galactokinase [Bryobacteraceae bacterium]|nr:galactokinase [Bryobacteraceae bacterium]
MAFIQNEAIINAFRDHFRTDSNPEIYRAPGRVNLIGEHTDYNLGYVFPIALEMACYVAIVRTGGDMLRLYSDDFRDGLSVGVADVPNLKPRGDWSDYVVGVAQQLAKDDVTLEGADLFIKSEVPIGSGLSSSAALEVSTAVALLGSQSLKPLEIALLAQRAESQFAGMPCGIMDQYASVFGKEGAAVQIDCRSLQHEYVPLPDEVAIIAVNSMVKHELGSSAYRERVAECRAAVEAMQAIDPAIQSLRDASPEFFVEVQESIPPIPRQRARHVIYETQRVLDFAVAARTHDLATMGKLFVASHRSMQYDYEISCEEIDFLVDSAIGIPGVYGARMTGGGFGGCTVNLVASEAVPEFQSALSAMYEERYGQHAVFYDCKPAAGAGRLS